MRKRLWLAAILAVATSAIAVPGSEAKQIGLGAAPGVSPSGSPYRYVAISPGRSAKVTIVERIIRDGGRINGWWALPGDFQLPPMTFNGSASGVSADGSTLVLSHFSGIFPPRRTELAILDTRVFPRHPHPAGHRPARPVTMRLKLSHSYSFAAISPHGSTIYLLEHLSPSVEGPFRIRSLGNGLRGRAPLTHGVRTRPARRLAGAMLDQVASPGGRWVYTLFGGKRHEPFLLALDTIGLRARSVGLPQLADSSDPFSLALGTEARGRRIAILNRRPSIPGSRPLLDVDTRSYEVSRARAAEPDREGGLPWLALGIGAVLLLCALGLLAGRGLALIALLSLTAAAIAPPAASAKGAGEMAAFGGVTAPGSDYRYIALASGALPNAGPGITFVARVRREGGKLSRWWYLKGTFNVPAVAYDGSAGGLSSDEGVLVLTSFPRTFPPRRTRFAILDTERSFQWRGAGDPPRVRRFFRYVTLPGDFSFYAISPNGSTAYLIERLGRHAGPDYITHPMLRALDVKSGELLPGAVAGRQGAIVGLPSSRAMSPDGRWAYTLYVTYGEPGSGYRGAPFILALDTARGRTARIALPELRNRRSPFMLALRTSDGGRRLTVLSTSPRYRGSKPLANIDTRSFEVSVARRQTAAAPAGDAPWLPVAIASALALLVAGAASLYKRRTPGASGVRGR